MIKTLKNTIKEIYNWTKDKVVRFKNWLVILVLGAAVVAAPLVIPPTIPDEHKLKCSKDKIYYSKEIKKELDNNGNEVDVDKIEYWYIELDSADENEIIEKRTKNTKYFTTTKKIEVAMEISVGLPYEKIGDYWYIHKKDRILREYYNKQTKSAFQKILKLNPVYATDVNEQVGASTDDCFYRGGDDYFSTTSTSYTCGNNGDSGTTYTLMSSASRFQTVNIPQGATINTAYLTLTCRTAKSGTTVNSNIEGEDVDGAATFSTLANYQGRVRTTASVAWNNISAWTLNTEYNSPSIVSVIQEIVNRGSWSANNDLVLFWDNNGSDFGSDIYRTSHSYDSDTAKATKLFIAYTAGGAERRMFLTQ